MLSQLIFFKILRLLHYFFKHFFVPFRRIAVLVQKNCEFHIKLIFDIITCGPVRKLSLIVNEFFDFLREKDKDSAYYNKEGNYNMIFTSNKNPALWREDFNEDSTLLCALDRIFDDATVFKLRGESFRGKKLETISLQTGKVKAIEPVTEIEE